jgi:hypothetical protein
LRWWFPRFSFETKKVSIDWSFFLSLSLCNDICTVRISWWRIKQGRGEERVSERASKVEVGVEKKQKKTKDFALSPSLPFLDRSFAYQKALSRFQNGRLPPPRHRAGPRRHRLGPDRPPGRLHGADQARRRLAGTVEKERVD